MSDIFLRGENVSTDALAAFAVQRGLPVVDTPEDGKLPLHIIAVQRVASGNVFEDLAPSCVGLIEIDGEQPDTWIDSVIKAAGQQSLTISLTTRSAFNVDTAQHCLSILISRGAITEAQANTLRLPVHEAIANALTHGNMELGSALRETLDDFEEYSEILTGRLADPTYANRRLDLQIDWTGGDITVCVHDHGKGYEGGQSSNAVKSGRGLAIIRSIASSVDVADGGRRIAMRFTH